MALDHGTISTLAVAILISVPLLFVYWLSTRPQQEMKPFPFLNLPAELRDMVYDELLPEEGISYPTKTPQRSQTRLDRFNSLFNRRSSLSKHAGVMMANHQLHREFHDVMSAKSKFTLYVDEHNYKDASLWTISAQMLKSIRRCELRFATTPAMMGTHDPRFMPLEWALCDRVCEKLRKCERLESVTLHIRPISNPLWNPLWVWYHASQAFKTAEGVKFDSIRFSLDSWTPGENQLGRWLENRLRRSSVDGLWKWECVRGHFIADDSDTRQPIRDFCGIIYEDCHVCHPPTETADAV
ncbi:hypothetical protein EJ05DRAFT_511639 [Pseudovirgaria hyperparasitica]|uniref:Uncharacterized protein n=1 Tax=Pseudovirgaria hyperparasitica TaxID=470096 RepID=A0A6A6W1R1_9PEZI|nr:uncharacterized protein EJ05DRAFT_511639 [Pseudovirgaria hyperparasitica]KAF2756858.1 hypothetical protein EJ05DRAFT_511639 [Pseudovirgaria hyperparasitica]